MNKIIDDIFNFEYKFKERFEIILNKYDMNYNCFNVLKIVSEKDMLTVSDVCDYLQMKNSSLTYVIDKLEKNKMIKRIKQEEDKRSYVLKITRKGKKIITELLVEYNNLLELTFNNINDLSELKDLINTMNENISG